jgi:hypothetical protein
MYYKSSYTTNQPNNRYIGYIKYSTEDLWLGAIVFDVMNNTYSVFIELFSTVGIGSPDSFEEAEQILLTNLKNKGYVLIPEKLEILL